MCYKNNILNVNNLIIKQMKYLWVAKFHSVPARERHIGSYFEATNSAGGL